VPGSPTEFGIDQTRAELLDACRDLFPADFGAVWAKASSGKLEPEEEDIVQFYYMEDDRRASVTSTYVLAKEIMRRLIQGADLETAFCTLLDFEWLAHTRFKEQEAGTGLRNLYRDHITHPAHVAALGRWLQKQVPFLSRDAVIKALRAKYGRSGKRAGVQWDYVAERAWYAAAFFHDIAYPVEFVRGRCEQVSASFPCLCSDWKHYQGLLARHRAIKTHLFKDCNRYQDVCKVVQNTKHCHAALGALYLLRLAPLSSLSRDDQLVIELASDAILHHHDRDPVVFQRHPLRYLLALSDFMHEWGREVIGWKVQGRKRVMHFFRPVPKVLISVDTAALKICFELQFAPESELAKIPDWSRDKLVEDKQNNIARFNPLDAGGNLRNGFLVEIRG
jgi:hypothetical protein